MSQHLAFRRQHLIFRRLRRSCRIALIPALLLMAIGSPLSAQDQGLDPGIAPNTRQPPPPTTFTQDRDPGSPPAGRIARSSLQRPEMRVDPVDPEVDQLLRDWSEHTKRFKTLSGKHYRATRDFAYGTASLAEGKFFVEMPDKGRIDVSNYTAPNPKPGQIIEYPAPDGKPTKLTIKAEDKREKWICDGKVVRVIDDKRRTYEEVPIPPDQQGANMIDGPLPFLLGMPPDKAKARYRFRLLRKVSDERVWLEVKPKFTLDAAEWVRAYVLLNLITYLPERVSLFNPAGSTETVYIFQQIDTNKRGLLQTLFEGDPFNPTHFGYRAEVHAAPASDPRNPQDNSRKMPLLVGASAKQAKRIGSKLQELGYDVKYVKGSPALSEDQAYHIESQQPEANTPLRPGQKILLRYYDTAQTVNRLDRQPQ
jgi:TIGR03009 family protein